MVAVSVRGGRSCSQLLTNWLPAPVPFPIRTTAAAAEVCDNGMVERVAESGTRAAPCVEAVLELNMPSRSTEVPRWPIL